MQTGKITALYVRFSFDDGIDTESGSIEHQKALLKNYAESNGFTNLSYYADDGYTGTNFNRPNFQRMMNDIKNGLLVSKSVDGDTECMTTFNPNWVGSTTD